MKKIFLKISISLLLFSILSVSGGSFFLIKSINAKSWPTSIGLITVSEIITSVEDGAKKYRAKVRYDYSVDGIKYVGNRVSLGRMSTKSYSEGVAQRYPIGKKVTVYYNGSDASESLLEVGKSVILLFFVSFSVVFLGISIALLTFRERALRFIDFFRTQ